MKCNKLIRIVEQPQEADKSAPTDDRSILSIYIIGAGRDYYLSPGEGAAPTGDYISLFIYIIAQT